MGKFAIGLLVVVLPVAWWLMCSYIVLHLVSKYW